MQQRQNLFVFFPPVVCSFSPFHSIKQIFPFLYGLVYTIEPEGHTAYFYFHFFIFMRDDHEQTNKRPTIVSRAQSALVWWCASSRARQRGHIAVGRQRRRGHHHERRAGSSRSSKMCVADGALDQKFPCASSSSFSFLIGSLMRRCFIVPCPCSSSSFRGSTWPAMPDEEPSRVESAQHLTRLLHFYFTSLHPLVNTWLATPAAQSAAAPSEKALSNPQLVIPPIRKIHRILRLPPDTFSFTRPAAVALAVFFLFWGDNDNDDDDTSSEGGRN